MDHIQYLNGLTAVERRELAKKIKVSADSLEQLRFKVRPIGWKTALKLAEHTGGKVRPELMRPDIWTATRPGKFRVRAKV